MTNLFLLIIAHWVDIYCFIVGHNFKIKRRINRDIREIECLCCHKEFAMNDEMEVLLPMDDELRELHNLLKSNQ